MFKVYDFINETSTISPFNIQYQYFYYIPYLKYNGHYYKLRRYNGLFRQMNTHFYYFKQLKKHPLYISDPDNIDKKHSLFTRIPASLELWITIDLLHIWDRESIAELRSHASNPY